MTAVAFPPPLAISELFSAQKSTGIFLLKSKDMLKRQSTPHCALAPEMAISGPILSKALDCDYLLLSLNALGLNEDSGNQNCSFVISIRIAVRTGV